MPSIEIHVNLFIVLLMILSSAVAGFALRSQNIRNLKSKVVALENEMLQNHAEILALQKEIAKTPQVSGSKTPVVSIKENNSGEEKAPSKKSR